MLSVPPVSHSASSAPVIDSGTDSMITNGCDEALELRRQHEVDEQQREHEHEVDLAAGLAELARLAVEVGLRRVAAARASPPSSIAFERLVDRVAGRERGGDLDRAQPVEVVERLRRDAFAHVDQVASCTMLAVARRARRCR